VGGGGRGKGGWEGQGVGSGHSDGGLHRRDSCGHQRTAANVSGFVFENSIGKPLHTPGLEKLVAESIRPKLVTHGYTWKTMYAVRHGAIREAQSPHEWEHSNRVASL